MIASHQNLTLIAVLVAVGAITALAQRPSPQTASSPAATTARIVAAAQAVAASLDDAGRATLQFPFDSAQKARWSNLPSPMFVRNGIRLTDLTPPQRDAVLKLLTVALSADGYQKVLDIMRGDEVSKRNAAGRGGPTFGQDEFYLAYLGTPSTSQQATNNAGISSPVGSKPSSITSTFPPCYSSPC